MVSYSAWDATTEHFENSQVFREALDFTATNMPDSLDFGNRNVYVGEFGMPENKFSTGQIQKVIPSVVETALDSCYVAKLLRRVVLGMFLHSLLATVL